MRVLVSTACVNNGVSLVGCGGGGNRETGLEKGTVGPNLSVSLFFSFFLFIYIYIYLFFSLLSLSPFGARVVHFLLSKIMTMLIFLTREEFFKLTCNQTGPRVFRWARRRRRRRTRRRGRTGDGRPHEGSKSSTYEPRYSSTGNPFSTAIPTVLSSPRFSKKHLPDFRPKEFYYFRKQFPGTESDQIPDEI